MTAILICRNPLSPLWQLGPLPLIEGHLAIIGWPGASATLEEGEPTPFARALLRALTQVARVTFPCSTCAGAHAEGWSKVVAGSVTVVERSSSSLLNASTSMMGQLSRVTLLSTRDPEQASAMFDDGTYPWSMQGQFALFSHADDDPPNVRGAFAALAQLFEPSWAGARRALEPLGVLGLLRPGVDGDLAGLLSFTPELESTFVEALHTQAAAAGASCTVLSETEFSNGLAS